MVNSWVCFSVNWYLPGKWAAPPAPAIMTSIPLPYADLAKSYIRSGVRCAETIVVCNIQISIIFTFSSNSTRYESRLSLKENGFRNHTSTGMLNFFNITSASFITLRSESDPIIIETRGLTAIKFTLFQRSFNQLEWKCVRCSKIKEYGNGTRKHEEFTMPTAKYNQQRNYMVQD